MNSHPPNKGYDAKPLPQHLEGVASACKKTLESLELSTTLIDKDSLAEVAFIIGLLHDIGKASAHFQNMLAGMEVHGPMTKHSLISALMAYNHFKSLHFPEFIPPLVFKVIQRHHGNLDSLIALLPSPGAVIFQTRDISQDVYTQISNNLGMSFFLRKHGITIQPLTSNEIKGIFELMTEYNFQQNTIEDSIELFLIENLLFSILVDCDKFDAARLKMDDYSSKVGKLNFDPRGYIHDRIKQPVQDELNRLRDQFITHIQNHPDIESDTRLYTITAPTGIGKTMACMAFVDSLQKKLSQPKRVIYSLPYTSIIDQNYEIYHDLFRFNHPDIVTEQYQYMLKHHHLEDYYKLTKDESDYDYWDYLNDNLIAESWSSAFVISTFVQLFHSIIGYRNSMLKKLHHIINSVIILDEIQSLDGCYYVLLRKIFKVLSERFATHILLCTATQPFIFEPGSFVELGIKHLFHEDVFNRVRLSWNPQAISVDDLIMQTKKFKFKSLLVVVNTKKTAIRVYEQLKEEYSSRYVVYCLTTLHVPNHRLAIIAEINERLKKGEHLILISTQLIEAGVDLSFGYVIRDFAPLESIIQVAGRCNRNGEHGILGGTMQVVNLKDDNERLDSHKIYDSYLLEQTRNILAINNEIESRQFFKLTRSYYSSLQLDTVSHMILDAIRNLNYSEDVNGQIPVSKFKVIQEDYPRNSVYVLTTQKSDTEFEKLLAALDKIREPELEVREQEELRLLITRTYRKLNRFLLSLSDSELTNYSSNMKILNRLNDRVYFIRFEDVPHCYSDQQGFLSEPLPYADGVFL